MCWVDGEVKKALLSVLREFQWHGKVRSCCVCGLWVGGTVQIFMGVCPGGRLVVVASVQKAALRKAQQKMGTSAGLV